ncbi:hypothetical protein Tco_0764589 [Tanacetum coccineum]
MDSAIPLGQKNTLAEYMILSGADNRPPMLDKDLVAKDLWERVQLLIQGTSLLGLSRRESFPPEWSKFVTDVKLVKDLHSTNFDQLHAYLEQHKLHTNEILTESPLVDSGFADFVFSPGDDPIVCLNKAMDFLTAVASSRRQSQSYSGTGYKSNVTSSRGNNASGQARVVKCYNYLGVPEGQAVQTIIPNNTAFQTEDLDTYGYDCDDISNAQVVLMANISNYGSDVISEVPHSKTYLNDMVNQGDFGKRFTPQQELSAEQAFWLRMSDPTSKPSDALPVKIKEAPKELPKISLVN